MRFLDKLLDGHHGPIELAFKNSTEPSCGNLLAYLEMAKVNIVLGQVSHGQFGYNLVQGASRLALGARYSPLG